jgi:uncharacterized protein involved in exopolysaccharide biosynthesis
LTRLQRTQIVNQNLLSYLVERHEEAKIRASASIGGLRTITPAGIPSAPLPNGASRNIMVSLFMGLGLGLVWRCCWNIWIRPCTAAMSSSA